MAVRIVEGLDKGRYSVTDDGVPGHKYGVRWNANQWNEIEVSSGMNLDMAVNVAEAMNLRFPNGPNVLRG